MEELDLLKKDWQKNENSFTPISEMEIYKMLHKKSSSVVRWILIISVLEFIFWSVITLLLTDDGYQNKLHEYGIEKMMFAINCVNYLIIIAFIAVFYKNYKTISTTDSTHQLMENILKTKKTVRNYIWYNLTMAAISIIISIVLLFYHNPEIISMMEKANSKGHKILFIIISTGISALFIGVIIGLFWLFYKLLYGILLKKLYANYSELEKIDL
ncbi:hypothetical protein [Flavobacterium psychrotolerans]|uniref:Beta-carotene 15,15'-monooxygenase n=1 Tax=Flavobacterium psychrotolerans TaxID=2169410 RepID=A0A2U1JJK2_9FLAO|nr:hypothetical protein [Flavobacterium psychrotolerans]PWA05321.1 hypothetical protein DB895_06885 [Flavobacterium psychrotolerans]